jgi:hypothetical protein
MAAPAVMADRPSMLTITLVNRRDAVVPKKESAQGVEPVAGVRTPAQWRSEDAIKSTTVASRHFQPAIRRASGAGADGGDAQSSAPRSRVTRLAR